MNERDKYRIGDLCRIMPDEGDDHMIYRVQDVIVSQHNSDDVYLTVSPAFTLVEDVENILCKYNRHIHVHYAVKLSIVDLGTFYVKFGQFIVSESKKFEQEDSAVCADISARNDR